MKIRKGVIAIMAMLIARAAFSQTNLNFNSVTVTEEGAIRLSWNSTSNEVYEIDYADSLIDTNTGSITWSPLYTDYPSHGTNTFWLDTGNYNKEIPILHPSKVPARYYKIAYSGANTATAPSISISSPTNGATVSGNLAISVSASSDLPILNTVLYVDGQEMPPSEDGTNFVINTCEWANGNHTLFAVAKGLSGFAGTPNDPNLPTRGYAVSAYVNVNFHNLISRLAFSEPYFEPSLGQTQRASAIFAANVNWTLQILDVNSNAVRTVAGNGGSMLYEWDGTGDGSTNLPAGIYKFLVSAATNGAPLSRPSGGGSPPAPGFSSSALTELPYPPLPPGLSFGLDELGNEITSPVFTMERPTQLAFDANNGPSTADSATPTNQTTTGPERPPNIAGSDSVGTCGVGYQVYSAPGTTFTTPPIVKIPGLPGSYIPLDGRSQQQASQPETWDDIVENTELANNFIRVMKQGRYNATVVRDNDNLKPFDLSGWTFNAVNVALLSVHCSFGSAQEIDGRYHCYLRLRNGGGNSVVKLDTCSFGGSGTNGLKFMALLACNALRDQNYNSMKNAGILPINNDLHLLCSTSTLMTAAPKIGELWAKNMMFGTNGSPSTVPLAWFDAGSTAYLDETNHLVINFRVTGWPDAFGEHITDVGSTPGSGLAQSDLTEQNRVVYNNP